MDVSSTALAQSVDNGIAKLNTDAHADLPASLGSTVAEVVRAAGGIVISGMQERDLQKDIPEADAAVQKLTASIDQTMKLMTDPHGLIDNLEDKLQTAYVTQCEEYRLHGSLPLPYEVILAYQQQWGALEQLRAQAAQAVVASESLRQAHRAILQSLTAGKTGLAGAVEQAQSTADQVKAGMKI